MKNVITFLIILLFKQTLACDCGTVPLIERIAGADFIATAKILKIRPDNENSDFHDIKIEIIDLFKGHNETQLKIYSVLNSSCAFFTPENSTWLIFAYQNINGDLSFGYCSGALQLDKRYNSDKFPYAEKNYKKSIELKLQVLHYFKNAGIEPTNEFSLKTFFPNQCLGSFKGFEVKEEHFAFYELTVDKNLSIKEINVLKEFDNENLKQNLIRCIKEDIKVYKQDKDKIIDNETKIIIALYYYAAERGDECFISQYDL